MAKHFAATLRTVPPLPNQKLPPGNSHPPTPAAALLASLAVSFSFHKSRSTSACNLLPLHQQRAKLDKPGASIHDFPLQFIAVALIGLRFTPHASSQRWVAFSQLRFVSLAMTSLWRDLRPQECNHAETRKKKATRVGGLDNQF